MPRRGRAGGALDCIHAPGRCLGRFAESEKRPVLLDAIAALGPGDILMVAKRDRLSRGDPFVTAMIEAAVQRAGARILSAAGEGTESDEPSSIL